MVCGPSNGTITSIFSDMFENFLSHIPLEIQHVLSTICLHINLKVHVACNFNYLFENDGLTTEVTASHLHML